MSSKNSRLAFEQRMRELLSDERRSELDSVEDSPDKFKMANLDRFNNIGYLRPGTRFRKSTRIMKSATACGSDEITEDIIIESDESGTRLYFSPGLSDKGVKFDKNMVFEVPCFESGMVVKKNLVFSPYKKS